MCVGIKVDLKQQRLNRSAADNAKNNIKYPGGNIYSVAEFSCRLSSMG